MLSGLLDDRTKRFVDEYVDSLVSWAIIVFYHENPGARHRTEELALHLGRRPADVLKCADTLVEKGLLKQTDGADAVYFYDPDPDLAAWVDSFVQALDDRETRLEILARVLEK
ncbi:MAG: hypothetical protein ACYC1U_08180 [Candidatus Aquicultorales bacterium]